MKKTVTTPVVTLKEGTHQGKVHQGTYSHTSYTGTRREYQKDVQEVWHPDPPSREIELLRIILSNPKTKIL